MMKFIKSANLGIPPSFAARTNGLASASVLPSSFDPKSLGSFELTRRPTNKRPRM